MLYKILTLKFAMECAAERGCLCDTFPEAASLREGCMTRRVSPVAMALSGQMAARHPLHSAANQVA